MRVTLLGKQCDAMIGLPRSEDFMGRAVIFSSTFAKEGYALVAAKGLALGGLDGLKGKRVAVQFASTPQNLLASRDDVQKVTVLSPRKACRLDQGKADVRFIWGPVAGWLNKTSYNDRYQIQLTEGEGLTGMRLSASRRCPPGSVTASMLLAAASTEDRRTLTKYGLPTPQPVRFGAAAAASAGITTGTGTGAQTGAQVTQLANVPATEIRATRLQLAPRLWRGQGHLHGTRAHCHGPDAIQRAEDRSAAADDRYGDEMREKFWTTVHEGRPSKGMPAWNEVFTDEQFDNIYSFPRRSRPTPTTERS